MSIPIIAGPAGYDSWYVKLYRELCQLLGSPLKFKLDWIASEKKLVIHTDRISDDKLETVNTLLEKVIPANIQVVRYNHDISIPWQEIPEGFAVVDYLESTGNQYFSFTKNLGTTEDETEIIFTKLTISSYGAILCLISVPPAELKSAEIQFNSNPRTTHSEALFQTWYFNADGSYTFPSKNGTCGYFYLNRESQDVARFSARKCYFNGVYKGVIDTEYKLPAVSLASIKALGAGYSARIFGLKHKSNKTGELLLNLIPCVDDTGAPCMLDRVTRTPFYNSGSGDFLYPTESTTFALRRVLPDWGRLTPTGLRRLYHAPKNFKGDILDYAQENGYKPIVEPERPAEGYWEPQWRETEEEIVLEWVETEAPVEEEITHE